VDERRRCEVGLGKGASRSGDHSLGVDGGGWSKIRGRGRLWQGLASGYPPPPRCQAQNDKGKGFENPWTPERDPQQILFPPSWSVCKRNKREREIGQWLE
jgi:hypothetical protein